MGATMFVRATAGVLVVASSLAVTSPSASTAAVTCTRSWAAPVSGSWSDASRWLPRGVPSSSDHVCITTNGTYTVTVAQFGTAASVRIGGANGTQRLVLGASCPAGNQVFLLWGDRGGVDIGRHAVFEVAPSCGADGRFGWYMDFETTVGPFTMKVCCDCACRSHSTAAMSATTA
jgi:hypothetical protein